MYEAQTRGITVRVEPTYDPDRSDPEKARFFWLYTIEIRNAGTQTVQLLRRHWQITDAAGRREEVRGAGVVGEQPVLAPGQSFRYTSGCPLTTPSGFMAGSYQMATEGGERFDVTIPAFSLDQPDAARKLN